MTTPNFEQLLEEDPERYLEEVQDLEARVRQMLAYGDLRQDPDAAAAIYKALSKLGRVAQPGRHDSPGGEAHEEQTSRGPGRPTEFNRMQFRALSLMKPLIDQGKSPKQAAKTISKFFGIPSAPGFWVRLYNNAMKRPLVVEAVGRALQLAPSLWDPLRIWTVGNDILGDEELTPRIARVEKRHQKNVDAAIDLAIAARAYLPPKKLAELDREFAREYKPKLFKGARMTPRLMFSISHKARKRHIEALDVGRRGLLK